MEIHLSRRARWFVGWAVRILLLLAVLGVPTGVWYLDTIGVGAQASAKVEAELDKVGLDASIGRITFDLTRGLEARNVVLRSKRHPGRDLAILTRLSISPSLNELVRGRLRIDEVRLAGSDVSIPVADRVIDVKNVEAEVVFPPDQIRVRHASGELFGIEIEASALLLHPNAVEIKQGQDELAAERVAKILDAVTDFFEKTTFAQPQPVLEFEVQGDLSNFETLEVAPILLRVGRFTFDGWKGEGIDLRATYRNQEITLDRLSIGAEAGESLELSGKFEVEERMIDFDLTNSINLAPLFRLLAPEEIRAAVKFGTGPVVTAQGEIDLSKPKLAGQVIGTFSMADVNLQGVEMDHIGSRFAWKDDLVYLRDFKANNGPQWLAADIWYQKDDFRVRAQSTLTPSTIASILSERDREIVGKLEFEELPHLSVDLTGPKANLDFLSGTGKVRLGRMAFQGGWIDSASADLALKDRAFTFTNLEVERPEGSGKGTLVYDFGKGKIEFDDIRASMMPGDVLKWAGEKVVKATKPYEFKKPPEALVNGTVDMRDPTGSDLSVDFASTGGIGYELLGRKLHFGKAAGHLKFDGRDVFARLRDVELFGGKLGLQVDVLQEGRSEPIYRANLQANGVDFESLTGLYFGYRKSEGKLSGQFAWESPTTKPKELLGHGAVQVRDGNVFAIPMFGPLSVIMNEIIPGAGYEKARNATANFSIQDGKLHTDDFEVIGQGFSMYGEGDLYLFEDEMDFSIRINAKGVPGIILFPVSKVFEYVSDGKMSDAEWRPKILPKGFLGLGDPKAGDTKPPNGPKPPNGSPNR